MEPTTRVKRIYDPVLGYHYLDDQDLTVVSHPLFQRLRRVNQLSAQHLFPSANHKRFEHCLGVMSLGTRAVDHLIRAGSFDQDQLTDSELQDIRTTARYAFLLHDIGHTPLSHACELFVDKQTLMDDLASSPYLTNDVKQLIAKPSSLYGDTKFGTNDLMTCALFLNYIFPYLEFGRDPTSPATSPIPRRHASELHLDANLFCRMVLGLTHSPHLIERILPRLLSDNAHDIDKLDYVYRDSKMTNPDLIAVDVCRLVEGFTVLNGNLVVSSGALGALINLISGRDIMYLWVYNHHTVCYTDELIRRYIRHLVAVANGDEGDDTRERLVIPRERALRLGDGHHRRGYLVDYYFSKEALCDGVDDSDVWTLLKTNRYLDSTTRLLYAQLLDREHLSCLYKTIVGFNAFLDELGGNAENVLRHCKGDGFEPALLESNIIRDNRILEEHDVYVTFRPIKLFDPTNTNLILVEDPVRRRETRLNKLMGHPSSAPSMFGGVPGEATVMPFIYYRDDKIDRQTLMAYLKEYRYP